MSGDAHVRICERLGVRFPRATRRNVWVSSEAAANGLIVTLVKWIEKRLRLKVNASKSGVGRSWERKFLGFRITREHQIEVAPESITRFKDRVRELWRESQSSSSEQLRDRWLRYLRGWWNYYRLAEWRKPIHWIEGWIRRHIRQCFWTRWHDWRGRRNAFQRLGVPPYVYKGANCSRGAWRMARHPAMHMALNNARLRRYRFLVPSDLAD